MFVLVCLLAGRLSFLSVVRSPVGHCAHPTILARGVLARCVLSSRFSSPARPPFTDRVFASWFTWRRYNDGSFIIAFAPVEEYCENPQQALSLIDKLMTTQKDRRDAAGTRADPETLQRDNEELAQTIWRQKDRAERVDDLNDIIRRDHFGSKALRGTTKGYWRFTPLAPSVTEVTYLLQANVGGSIPRLLLNTRIKSTLGSVRRSQDIFSRNGNQVRAAPTLKPTLPET